MSVLALGGSLEWPLEELQCLALPHWCHPSALEGLTQMICCVLINCYVSGIT